MARITAQEKKWEAENDARTLAKAIEIQQNRGRFSKAKKEASRMAKEQEKQANALKRISVKPTTKRTVKKKTVKRKKK